MNELEQQLKARRLPAPSADLDRRIEATFAAARRNRNVPPPEAFWWGLGALLAASCFVAGFVVTSRPVHPAPETVVYPLEAQGRLRQMLLGPAASPDEAPAFVFHIDKS